ncbi:hypothetical protein LCGC14_3143520 [marine sediment metagenome]|uniref:Uncharacterized protein n=1 Tax=marine sediment metagenome TaxID=412755 RepID=A0A0F8WK41_9ZZZZ
MFPNLNPAWSTHAAGFQISVGAVAVLSPSSVNIASIIRTGVGVYDITMDALMDPGDGILFLMGGAIGIGVFDTIITSTVITVNVLDFATGLTDGIFKFIYFRFRTP